MFKKILMALATTTLVASPIVTAQAQAQSHAPQHRQVETRKVVKQKPNGRTVVKKQTVVRKDTPRYNSHRWAKGQRFDRNRASNYRVISNYRDYRLSAPPRGQQWVRSGNDAVLIAITSGLIGAVVGNAIR